jgi:hypothetical protein
VNRTLLVIVLAAGVILGGTLLLLNWSRPAPPPETVAEVAPPAPEPVAPPPVETPAPEAAPAPAPPPRPRPAPKPSAPVPAPVEASPAAVLQIDSDVPGAQVFLNREFVGATPLTVPNLAPGEYQINVSAKGYESIAQTVELASGSRDIMVRFREVRLDARLDVVHNHRFGSCRGRLVATPAGLRYETTDKNDAFNVALMDLEIFEVNYLEKNLRVQARKGRRYDFTDPEGNADRLFVFHRDVEKAREQLRRGDQPAGQ